MPGVITNCPTCGRWQLVVVSTRDALMSRGVRAHDVEAGHIADIEVFLAAHDIADEDDDAVVIDLRKGPARCKCGDVVTLRDLGALARLELAPGVVAQG